MRAASRKMTCHSLYRKSGLGLYAYTPFPPTPFGFYSNFAPYRYILAPEKKEARHIDSGICCYSFVGVGIHIHLAVRCCAVERIAAHDKTPICRINPFGVPAITRVLRIIPVIQLVFASKSVLTILKLGFFTVL